MKRSGTICALMLTLVLTACGGGGAANCPDGFTCTDVSADDYGASWPLSVDAGALGCKPVDIVTFTTSDGEVYAVNSIAEMTTLYADIHAILASAQGDPGPLRTDGLRLCSQGA